MINILNEESRSNGIVCVSTDNSVVSMDTDNDEYSGDMFLTKGADFDLTESCPEIYRCPISKELMQNPVMYVTTSSHYLSIFMSILAPDTI